MLPIYRYTPFPPALKWCMVAIVASYFLLLGIHSEGLILETGAYWHSDNDFGMRNENKSNFCDLKHMGVCVNEDNECERKWERVRNVFHIIFGEKLIQDFCNIFLDFWTTNRLYEQNVWKVPQKSKCICLAQTYLLFFLNVNHMQFIYAQCISLYLTCAYIHWYKWQINNKPTSVIIL